MSCRSRMFVVAMLAPLAAGVARSQAPSAAAGSAAAVALTIEGGGSLGAYEAGLSWALVEAFRQRRALGESGTRGRESASTISMLPRLDLIASAGASAGSINALLASVAWCSAGAAQPAEETPFWKAWVSTGVAQLAPRPRTPGWAERGVYSREHFTRYVLPEIHADWEKGSGVDGCQVAFGATVTKFTPDSVEVAKSLYARNQRFAAAALVRPPLRTGGEPRFSQPRIGPQSFGPTGYLLTLPDRDGEIQGADIERLLMASSAYPLAFEPTPLRYCRAGTSAAAVRLASASRSECISPDSADFLDGAVFDNGPLALAYDLAHANEPAGGRTPLFLLYVTPDRRRASRDGRRDLYLSRGSAGPSSPAKRRPEGLDAGLTIVSNFIPAAREYELQLASRLLPQTTNAEQEIARKDALLAAATTDAERFAALATEEHRVHLRAGQELDSAWLRLLDNEVTQRRQAQFVAAICRMRPAECGNPTMVDSLIAAFGVDSIPPAPAVPAATLSEPLSPPRAAADTVAPASFAHRFYLSTRWHPLAGEWLSQFGAFLGQPLREYDFWVGVYDALSLMAHDAICNQDPSLAGDATCPSRTLRRLLAEPPIALSRSGRMALLALYRAEFPTARTDDASHPEYVDPASASAVSEHDVVLLAVIDAMMARMRNDGTRRPDCRSGSFVQRSACSQGIEAFFASLRDNSDAMDALERAADACGDARPLTDGCFADRDFLRVVRQPGAELDAMAEFVLHRLDETTPVDGSSKTLVLIANAAYYATNEAMRRGWDYGSTSLPRSLYAAACDSFSVQDPTIRHLRRCSQKALRFYPSSIGVPLFPASAQYAEWTMRYNWPGGLAAGAVLRLMTSNGRRLSREGAPRMIESPGIRAEKKTGSLLLPSFGVETGYWMDSNHSLFSQPAASRVAYGATMTALASKLRFTVTRIPDGYRPTSSSRRWLWTGGLGDVNGMVYWLWRLTTE